MHKAACIWLTLVTLSVCPGQAFAREPLLFVLSDSNVPISYADDKGNAKGLMADLMHALLKQSRGVQVTVASMPWVRAQREVQLGKAQLYCTYPSEARKRYALFSRNPLFVLDYGFLIYNKKSSKASSIRQATELKDLNKFTFASQSGVSWEDENIPKSVKRVYVNKMEALLHLVLARQSGDFFIMPAEQANYHITRLGYAAVAGIHPVDFIPNSKVEFHLGINKDIPEAREILTELERAMGTSDFLRAKEQIIKDYRSNPQEEIPTHMVK